MSVNEHVLQARACTEMEEYLFDLNGYLILKGGADAAAGRGLQRHL